MSLVTTINSTPIPSVPATTIQSNIISGVNTQASGTITIPVVNSVTAVSSVLTPISISTHNSISPALKVSIINSDNSQVHQILNKQRLQDLVREVDPNVQNDDDVEELLLALTEEFIEDVVLTSCLLAKHRKSNALDVKDVQLSLEKNWNMYIPGFGCEELRPYKKSATTEAHKQRMALIRKTLKK
ncbi:transcription initiation factor TFIID subunit 12-like isoform X1 [Uloborus diversus]|uniref:transcription initiation factor TFIID subunit 12-like isoform X1 n=1 Tax=Uloborus diversus TaxID=327109 RepID=UPI0024092C56|nr:transcription initiation factor TFIID subunit 12-like isoform X1 [Uloborus diversus]